MVKPSQQLFLKIFGVDRSSSTVVQYLVPAGIVVSDTYKDDGDFPLFFGVPA